MLPVAPVLPEPLGFSVVPDPIWGQCETDLVVVAGFVGVAW